MDEVSGILIKRRDNQLSFNFSSEDGDFFLVSRAEGDNSRFLKNLNKVIGRSVGKFPCGHFSFDDGSLTHPILQAFLNIHGENIRGLQLIPEFSLSPQVDSDEEEQAPEEPEEKEFDPTHLTKLLVQQAKILN